MTTPRSTLDWVLEAFAVAILLAIFAVVAGDWNDLPLRMPVHFNVHGNPDGFGGKKLLLVLPLAAISSYVLLTVASRNTKLVNLPMDIDRDAPGVRALLQSMAIALKVVVLATFLYIAWTMVRVGQGHASGLGRLFLPLSTLLLFVILGYYLIKLRRFRA
jgi:uncharacterized membrane protein